MFVVFRITENYLKDTTSEVQLNTHTHTFAIVTNYTTAAATAPVAAAADSRGVDHGSTSCRYVPASIS